MDHPTHCNKIGKEEDSPHNAISVKTKGSNLIIAVLHCGYDRHHNSMYFITTHIRNDIECEF